MCEVHFLPGLSSVLLKWGLGWNYTPLQQNLPFFQSCDNIWAKTGACSLLQHHSRCSIAACIFSKVVILLHVLQISCGELGEVLRASVVQVIWWCKVKVLSFIFPLILYLWKNFCKPEKQTLIIQDHSHKNRKVFEVMGGWLWQKHEGNICSITSGIAHNREAYEYACWGTIPCRIWKDRIV